VQCRGARSISGDLIEWADDPEAEPQAQADLLRRLVRDPSQRVVEDG
jgi:hypothetical protein